MTRWKRRSCKLSWRRGFSDCWVGANSSTNMYGNQVDVRSRKILLYVDINENLDDAILGQILRNVLFFSGTRFPNLVQICNFYRLASFIFTKIAESIGAYFFNSYFVGTSSKKRHLGCSLFVILQRSLRTDSEKYVLSSKFTNINNSAMHYRRSC